MHRVILNRRDVLQAGALGAFCLAHGGGGWAAQAAAGLPITKAIPSSGELLPVVGIGTNAFNTANQQTLDAVLARFVEDGSTLIDTAAGYGESEETIGTALAKLKLRNKVFLATKLVGAASPAPVGMAPPGGGLSGATGSLLSGGDSFERSLRRLQTDHIDLMQVHNLNGADALVPQLLEWKKAGKIRYLGITTSNDRQHEQMAALMRRYPLDFVQVNYSLGLRNAEQVVFPVAIERKIAVIANVPLGGRGASLLARTRDRLLPPWAADFDASSWPQLLLKYVVSHPAVTATITGMTKPEHVDDNTQAARGKLPDAAQRRRLEELWATFA